MKALLLVGSPRAERSSSYALGAYLMERLKAKGFEIAYIHIQSAMRADEGKAEIVTELGTADVVVLSFPTYIDSTPAAVVAFMEFVADQRKDVTERPKFIAIANCGFPEAEQNNVALSICRLFARDSGLEWYGGLALGMGSVVAGRPLEGAGGMARNIRRSLDMTARALAMGNKVPPEAVDLMAKRPIPRSLYLFFSNRMWKVTAKRRGVKDQLYNRPYEKVPK